MNCNDVRQQLTGRGAVPHAGSAIRNPPVGAESTIREHLSDCRDCTAYARRLDAAHHVLSRQHAGIDPDAGFAARVIAGLPQRGGLLAWAALKLLPAVLALAMVLAGWVLVEGPGNGSVPQWSPTDDLLGWVLENPDGAS